MFRGEQLLMLESVEASPRRFTVRLPTAELPNVAEVRVTRLWVDGLGSPTVGSLVIGGVSKDFAAFPA